MMPDDRHRAGSPPHLLPVFAVEDIFDLPDPVWLTVWDGEDYRIRALNQAGLSFLNEYIGQRDTEEWNGVAESEIDINDGDMVGLDYICKSDPVLLIWDREYILHGRVWVCAQREHERRRMPAPHGSSLGSDWRARTPTDNESSWSSDSDDWVPTARAESGIGDIDDYWPTTSAESPPSRGVLPAQLPGYLPTARGTSGRWRPSTRATSGSRRSRREMPTEAMDPSAIEEWSPYSDLREAVLIPYERMLEKRVRKEGDSALTIPDASTQQELEPGADRESPWAERARVEGLAKQGVVFSRIPEGIEPGMWYTTPADLAESDAAAYSPQQMNAMIRKGEIPAYKVAGRTILDLAGVEQVVEREREHRARKLHSGGRRPGPKGPQTVEGRRTDSIDLLTVAEAAEQLGISQPSVIELIHRERLPARRAGSGRGRWLIDAEAVRTFRRAKPGPQSTKP